MRTIAWATDGSPSARNALATAKQLSRATGARLLVLHVQERGITRRGFLVDRHNDHVATALRRVVGQLRQEGFDAELRVGRTELGGEHRMILHLAQEAGVDLLVVGNPGHGPLAGLFLGSVALRLVQAAPFPVLMVPSGARTIEKPDREREAVRAARS